MNAEMHPEERAYLQSLGRRVRKARKIHGITQVDLAVRVNVHRSTIRRMERGEQVTLWTAICVIRVMKQLQKAPPEQHLEIFD